MGAFNTLKLPGPCPHCGQRTTIHVQFRYGSTWQHVYSLGEALRWGGNQKGDPSLARVAVEGIGSCPLCGRDFEYDIIVVDGVIRGVRLYGPSRRAHSEHGYAAEP